MSDTSRSESWAYRGFRARLGDTSSGSGSAGGIGGIVVDIDMHEHVVDSQTIPAGQPHRDEEVETQFELARSEQVAHLENLRTVAFSWVMDTSRRLPVQIRSEVDDMVTEMTGAEMNILHDFYFRLSTLGSSNSVV